MNVLLRKAISDITRRKGRTLLAILGIFLGIAGLTAVNQASDQLGGAFFYTTDPSAVPTIVMTMNTLPDAVVTQLERVPHVEQFQQRSVYNAPWQYASSTQDHSMQLFVYQDMEHIKLWPFELVYGHLPGPGEIVLDTRNQLEGYQATLGDTIAVQAPNGQFVSLRVVGLSRTRGSAVGGLFANPIGYMSPAAFQLINPGAANANTVNPVSAQVLAKTADAHALETYNTMKQILVSAHITLDAKSSSWNYAAGQATLQLSMSGPLIVIQLLTGLSLLLVCVMIFNSITTLLAEQIKIIGTMKALGGTRWRIIGSYQFTVAIYSILGTAIGLEVGLFLGYQLASHLASTAQVDIAPGVLFDAGPFQVSPSVILTSCAVGLLAPALSALLPLWTGTRITISEAISAYGVHGSQKQGRQISSQGALLIWIPQTFWMGLRGLFRKRERACFTLFGLTLSCAIFLAILITNDSLASVINAYASPYHNPDVRVDLGLSNDEHAQPVVNAIRALPNVENVIPLAFGDAIIAQHRLFLTGVAATSYRPAVVAGRWLQDQESGALVLSDVAAQRLRLSVGESLDVQVDIRTGMADKTVRVNWKIVGLVHDYSDVSGSADPNGYLGQAYTTLHAINGVTGSAADYADRLSVKAHDRSAQALRQLKTRINAILTQQGLNQSEVRTIQDLMQGTTDPLPTIYLLFFAVALLVALVGLLSLSLTLITSVLERRMEIGIVRSLGATGWRVGTIFCIEGLILAFLAWGLGSLTGIPGGAAIVGILSSFLGPHDVTFQVPFLFITLAFILLVTLLASFGPVITASRMRIQEILRYE